ncbi:hypothetical protein FHW79_005559 [Azospirillum sp. OGB3]|uniref:NAD/NADP transhydrogenase alpha subunit-like protein n=1 Tax=Azospirillum sp. OGB3 TaxID=2587012 RepID=UPI00184CCE6E|nr:NAD/NADP transhydrogenase alpha subunit-like protein [Azospirillum sp. OGB3]MBB3267889.1 hypothetical protein [Azospirillum sp. OGB3]
MQGFRTYQDDMGLPTAILHPSSSRHVVALTAGVGQTVTVPNEAVSVLFNATGLFWVQYGGGAALPTGSDLSGGAPELAPQARRVEAGTVLGLVAPAACLVSLSFFGGRS